MLWRYSTEAVELRYRYLANASPGCASRTVLVTDIAGLPEGTVLNRALRVGGRRWVVSSLLCGLSDDVASCFVDCLLP
jgi:hypothetical protein